MTNRVEPLTPKLVEDDQTLDRHWHLARTDAEISLTELEYAVYRIYAAFERWQTECMAAVAHQPLNSTENAVLHVIQMKDRPKTIAEIGRLLNRDDIPNLQYAIRKLLKSELIKKNSTDRKRGLSYRTTDAGRKVCEDYARLRREQLLPMLETVRERDEMVETSRKTLEVVKAVYDSAAINVAAHRRPLESE